MADVKYKYINEDGTPTKEGQRLDKENNQRSIEEQHRAASAQAERLVGLEEQLKSIASEG